MHSSLSWINELYLQRTLPKRAQGRPKKNWMEGISEAMNERNLHEGQWADRKQWNLGVGQRGRTF
jgi:hypothetical protein